MIVNRWINDHIHWIVGAWLVGALFFGGRMLRAWTYTRHMRQVAEPVVGIWKNRLQELAADLGISRSIRLLQSRLIDAPILLGYLKPVILLPVGMMSGLSTEQVETILLHELAHIKRGDYIVNLIQSVAEVVFFFNPWVWAISSQIRLEREQCCDDRVVKLRSPLTYAQALHQLEEARTINPVFVLAASGNKNQLLNRIKRIMEPSERKEQGREKVFPALMVILALLGASWFSIQAYLPESKSAVAHDPMGLSLAAAADTTKKDLKKEKSATYSRKSVTTYDEKGEPHEEVTEEFNGDEELRPMLAPGAYFDMPDFPPFADLAPLAGLAPDSLGEMNFNFPFPDSLPGPSFHPQNDRDWEAFGKEFTERFQERFSDFYKKNQPEFDNMMKELEKNLEKMQGNMDHMQFGDARMEKEMHRLQEELRRLAPQQKELLRQEGLMQRHQQAIKKMEQDMQRRNEEWGLKMKDHEYHMKSAESKMKVFEKELTALLVKDGYLGKDENIKTINWNDDGSIEVNGKQIKDQDRSKDQELHRKYFKEGSRLRYVQ
jgi:hypothetical protein